MKRCLVALAVTLVCALGCALAWPDPRPSLPPKGAAAERAQFFKGGKVYELVIEIDKPNLDSLRREPRKYAKATLKEGDKVVGTDVGIHVKGAAGSFRGIDDKPGLTLNMDKFKDDQVFHGVDKFHLANSVQDPSYLNELICGELFRAAGVPASHVTHALVTINGKKKGLYYIKEGYDGGFLRDQFGTKDGNFYDGGFLRDIDQPLQLVSNRNDVTDRSDLKALLAATKEKDLKQRYKKMEQLLDVDKFVSYLVLEVVCGDWDGYPLNRNNYRIFHEPKANKITFIPSGMDQMFRDPNTTIQPGFQGTVARALVETPEGKEKYFARLSEVMEKVYKTEALLARLDELQKAIQPSLEPGPARDFANNVKSFRDAIKQREKSVNDQIKKLKK